MKIHQRFGEGKFYNGDVGVEIEMEGLLLPAEAPVGWHIHREGSLRGGGLEYVFRSPASPEKAKALLGSLWKKFKDCGSVLQPSHRCSTHVHVNVQEMTEIEVWNFIILYLICEDALVRWCGDRREGNLFCLRARDAEYLIDLLEEVSRTGSWLALDTDTIRYAAVNCNAILRKGSLEFRALRGTEDPELILKWIDILLKLRAAAKHYRRPDEIIRGFSEGGERAFCEDIFKEHYEELFGYDGWEVHVKEGMRRSQCIAFSGDWGMFEQKSIQDLKDYAVRKNMRERKKVQNRGPRNPRLKAHPLDGLNINQVRQVDVADAALRVNRVDRWDML